MKVYINNIPSTTPDDFMTIQTLLEWYRMSKTATSVVINDINIARAKWKITRIKDLDRITIVTGSVIK